MTTQQKREREQQVVACMIGLYCRKKHHTKGTLCPDCSALLEYARARSQRCPFMEKKDLLFPVSGALLPAGDAGKDPSGHAVFGPADAAGPPDAGAVSYGRDPARENT